jgi:hypothetical protein
MTKQQHHFRAKHYLSSKNKNLNSSSHPDLIIDIEFYSYA